MDANGINEPVQSTTFGNTPSPTHTADDATKEDILNLQALVVSHKTDSITRENEQHLDKSIGDAFAKHGNSTCFDNQKAPNADMLQVLGGSLISNQQNSPQNGNHVDNFNEMIGSDGSFASCYNNGQTKLVSSPLPNSADVFDFDNYKLTESADTNHRITDYSGTVEGHAVSVHHNANDKIQVKVDGKTVAPGQTNGPVRYEAGGPGGDGVVHISHMDKATGGTIDSAITEDITADTDKDAKMAQIVGPVINCFLPDYWKHNGLTMATSINFPTGE